MFSAGRILKNRRESRVQSLGFNARVRLKKKEKRKFRCYIPCLWQAMVAAGAGLFVVLVGTGMCVIGYYTGYDNFLSIDLDSNPELDDNDTLTVEADNTTVILGGHLKFFTYVGPVLMSFGCFTLVFSCVVVCETRDKVLELMDERKKLGLDPNQIDIDFFRLVVPQLEQSKPKLDSHRILLGNRCAMRTNEIETELNSYSRRRSEVSSGSDVSRP